MTIDEARQFILRHPEAELQEHRLHARFLQAVEVVEIYKRERREELARSVVLDNPRIGRMRR